MFSEEEIILPSVRELQYFVREGERWSRVNNLTDISNATFKKPKSKANAADYVIEALCKQQIDTEAKKERYDDRWRFSCDFWDLHM